MAATKRKKLYPLTVAQKLHFFTLQYCEKKEVLNIGTSLVIQDEIDFDVLRQSIYMAYDRCEAMRIRFCKGKKEGEILQYIAEKEEREIEYFSFGHWKLEDAEKEMRKWSAIPFERYDSPMNRIVMISMPEGYHGLYMNVDHMTMDSSAIITFMSDLIGIYCAMKFDVAMPKAPASYLEQLEKDLAYEAGSPAQLRDKAFWKSEVEASEPIFNDLEGLELLQNERKQYDDSSIRAVRIATGNVDANHAVFRLETDPSDRLLAFCADYKIPMVCLLMLALRTQLSKENAGEEDVSIMTTVSRRATLLEKRSAGTRIHYFPCRTVIGRDKTFLEALHMIQEAQNRIFRHANADPTEVLISRNAYYKLRPGQGYECMSLTYQPLTMRSMSPEVADIKYRSKWYPNGAAANPLYLTVMHQSLDEGMDFYFEYQTGRITEQELEKLYYYMCRILFKGVENPSLTIGEIMDTI